YLQRHAVDVHDHVYCLVAEAGILAPVDDSARATLTLIEAQDLISGLVLGREVTNNYAGAGHILHSAQAHAWRAPKFVGHRRCRLDPIGRRETEVAYLRFSSVEHVLVRREHDRQLLEVVVAGLLARHQPVSKAIQLALGHGQRHARDGTVLPTKLACSISVNGDWAIRRLD